MKRTILAVGLVMAAGTGILYGGIVDKAKIDSVKLVKLQKVLKSVDDLDDMKLYGDVAELLYNANSESVIADEIGLEVIKFGTPEQVEKIRGRLSPETLEQEQVRKYLKYAEARARTAPGSQFVDFEGEDDGGNKIRLSDFVKPGKYTLIDFWAGWCPYCVRELPELARLRRIFADKGFDIVGVAVREEPAKTKNMVDKKGIDWPVIYNTQMIPYDIYGFVGIPHHILVGPDGKIISRGESVEQIASRLENVSIETR